MSDTMRDEFEAWCISDNPRYRPTDDSVSNRRDWQVWQAAQSQPAPPVPASVQEIMRLMMPYVRACVNASLRYHDKPTNDARLAECESTLKPLEAALTALIDDNHRLKFELDGLRAMRGSLTDEQIRAAWNECQEANTGTWRTWKMAARWAESAIAKSETAPGWKMVPIEATPSMIDAGYTTDPDGSKWMQRPADSWRSMIASTPPTHGIEPEQGGNHG